MPVWHAMDGTDALRALESRPGGLSDAEAAARVRDDAPPDDREGFWEEFAESLREPLQLLLIVVAVLSAVFGDVRDAAAIGVVVVAVAVTETLTELRASRAIAALRRLSAPTARVLRSGAARTVPASEVVPGDVCLLVAGDVPAADARVLEASGLRVDESTLTGEAYPAAKGAGLTPAGTPLAERTGMLYAGTSVLSGEARAVAVATGPGTELGRLGRLVATEHEPPTPLQRALRRLARVVLIAAITVSVAVPALGLLTGQDPRTMLLSGLALAFATVPEELPILVTLLLAVGGHRLARHGALVRRLRTAETLGAMTTVVTDKTGTLTQNHLQAARLTSPLTAALITAAEPADSPIATALSAPAEPDTQARPASPGASPAASGPPVAGYPFDAARRLAGRVYRDGDGLELAVCGAPEAVLAACTLGAEERERVLATVRDWSGEGLRVIAAARRRLAQVPPDRDAAERDLEYAGLAGFADPLRDGVPAAVSELRQAGVSTIVVSGDHPVTATATAHHAGLPAGPSLTGGPHGITEPGAPADAERAEPGGPAEAEDAEPDAPADAEGAVPGGLPGRVDGEVDAPAARAGAAETESGDAGDAVLDGRLLRDGTVIGRATPEDKLRVVRALQARGEVVAVTGDGVNDGPALAAADVGIAMGRRGSELARRAAGLVLTDDAYPTVVAAIARGRAIGSQLRRAVAFYLGAKLALVVIMLAGLVLGRGVVFTPAAIVLLELFMDLGASVAFVAEPAAPEAMRRPPRAAGGGFLDRTTSATILVVAAALTAAVLPAYLLAAPDTARTAAALAWLAGHALVAWSLRARPALSWRRHPAFPIWAAAAVATGLAASLAGVAALAPLTPHTALITAACVLLAVIVAAAGRVLLRTGTTL